MTEWIEATYKDAKVLLEVESDGKQKVVKVSENGRFCNIMYPKSKAQKVYTPRVEDIQLPAGVKLPLTGAGASSSYGSRSRSLSEPAVPAYSSAGGGSQSRSSSPVQFRLNKK